MLEFSITPTSVSYTHLYSLDAAEYEGEDYADGSTPETELFLQLENQWIKEVFEQLSEVQRRRLLMLAEGVSFRAVSYTHL